MKKIITFTLLIVAITVFAQNLPTREIITGSNYVRLKSAANDNDIEGDVYLNKHWYSQIVMMTPDNKTLKLSRGNFNIKENAFAIETSKDSIIEIENSMIKELTLGGKRFKKIDNDFYEIMSDQKLKLYKKYKLDVVEGPVNPLSKAKVTPDKYKIQGDYFVFNDGDFNKVKLKKSSILKSLNKSDVASVKKFAKQNHLSFKKENDVIKILNYYNTL